MKLSLVLVDVEKIPTENYVHFMEIIHNHTLFVASSQSGFNENWVVNCNRYSDATITQLLSHDMLLAILKEALARAAASESQRK
jgi:hypothetical protein